MKNLQATLQKSYYGKAKTYQDNDFVVLRSYDTDVCMYSTLENKFVRLWNGYSVTTMNHINDFRMQNNLEKLSKKEWLQLPCVNAEPTYNVYMSNGWTTHKCPALLTEAEAEREAERIQKNDTKHRLCVWYE